MGLLDSIIPPNGQGGGLLADPLFRIGMSLLARGGPSKTPHSFGQDLSGSVDDLRQQDTADTTDEMKRLQLQDYKESLARKKKTQDLQDQFMRSQMPELYGGQPLGGGPAGQPALMPTMTTGAPQASPLGQGFASGAPTAMIPGQPTTQPTPQQTGLSPGYAARVGKFESGDNYDSRSDVSSARGRYQFTDGTYKDMAPLAGVDPTDWSPAAQDHVFERFTKSNIGRLQMAGLPVNDVNAYSMHLLGPTAGQIFANAADSARVDQIGVGEEARNNNPSIFKGATTVGEARKNIQDKVFGADAATPAAPANTPAQAQAPATPLEISSGLNGMPAAVRKRMITDAAMATVNDPDKFFEVLGNSMRQYDLQQAERDAKSPTYGDPKQLSDGTWRRTRSDGVIEDITDQMGGKDNHRVGVQSGIPQAKMLDINNPDDQPDIEQLATYHVLPVPPGNRNAQAQRQNQLEVANAWRKQHGLTPYTEGMAQSIKKVRDAYNNGVEGRATTAASTAVNHLSQMEGLIGDLQNGKVRTFNALANNIKDQFGLSAAPSNWTEVSRFVGDEIAKAVIPGSGSREERLLNQIRSSGSPEILQSNIQQYIGLLGGQLLTREQNYNTGMQELAKDVPFSTYLLPNARNVLEEARTRSTATVPGEGGGGDVLPLPANKKDLVKGKTYKFPDGHTETY